MSESGFWFVPNGMGAGRIPRDRCLDGDRQTRAMEMLSRSLNLRTLVVFVGSGCSNSLGYPRWTKLASYVRTKFLSGEQALDDPNAYPSGVSSATFILGKALHKNEEDLRKELLDIFQGKQRIDNTASTASTIHDKLLALPVRRFATTNYDTEIEYALAVAEKAGQHGRTRPMSDRSTLAWDVDDAGHKLRTALAPDPSCAELSCAQRSFTQRQGNERQIAEFIVALPRRDDPTMVFHLHGRCDDFESMILSEEHYQRWYLNDADELSRQHRQAIELLLGSNPLLFVGFSMSDPELLQCLRTFGIAERDRKDSRPLFVMLNKKEPPAEARTDAHRMVFEDSLYERYGTNVIWFGENAEDNWSKELEKQLDTVLIHWQRWQLHWIEKPKLIEASVDLSEGETSPTSSKCRSYAHNIPGPEPTQSDPVATRALGRSAVAGDVRRICKALCDKKRAIVFLGPGGAGKSRRAVELFWFLDGKTTLEEVIVPEFDGAFFWSSYYSDDWLTGIDLAIRFLERLSEKSSASPTPAERSSCDNVDRVERFETLLSSRKALLIFDGFERLLSPSGNAEEGKAYNGDVKQFLQTIWNNISESCCVLTSRLWPEEFGSLAAAECDEFVLRVKPLAAAEITDAEWSSPSPLKVDYCSLLEGHAYGMRLAHALANKNGVDNDELVRKLQRTPPHQRVSRIIGAAIEDVEQECSPLAPSIVRGFLERVALFMSPVTESVLDTSLDQAKKDTTGPIVNREVLVQSLTDHAILTPVISSGMSKPKRWTLHPLVRGYVFHRLHGARSEDLPNFTLPGFTSGTAAVDPGSRQAGEVVKDLLETLMTKAYAEQGNPSAARDAWRAAFSVMRSRMEAITAPRWISYSEYIRYGVRMLNLAKCLSRIGEAAPRLWSFAATLKDACHAEAVVGPEELSWLYNDLGLALCCEGSMHDAFAVWEQGYQINRLIEGSDKPGHFVVQSLLHLCHTMMEMGNINAADEYMHQTEQANATLKSDDFAARILGYQGLLAHLRGNLMWSETCLSRSINKLESSANKRAEAIFLRYRADLRIRLARDKEARSDIDTSRSLAQTGNDPDLVAYARKSLGHWLRSQGKIRKARVEYETALREARRMGIRRLEADVLSELSHLALDAGDAEAARVNAMHAMRIANELGLGLRQCHGLVVLGRANIVAGHRDLGIGYLQTAYKLSRASGYWLRANNAEEILCELGAPIDAEANSEEHGGLESAPPPR